MVHCSAPRIWCQWDGCTIGKVRLPEHCHLERRRSSAKADDLWSRETLGGFSRPKPDSRSLHAVLDRLRRSRTLVGMTLNQRTFRSAVSLARYSESQTTSKLVPSDVRLDGTASFAPVLPLTMIDSSTLLPKALIAPDTLESVASLVLATPV